MIKSIKCPDCLGSSFYTLKDMTRVCKKCGRRWNQEQMELEEISKIFKDEKNINN